ncbi:MAG: putative membrane protein YqiK [Kiritimatiellia bacterium]|jgi:uncharacterized membrane protein YqiK
MIIPTMGIILEGFLVTLAIAVLVVVGLVLLIVKCYRKVEQGKALIRNGIGGTKVSFSGMVVVPVFHKLEVMDISVKRVEIFRHGVDGLVCKDNLRADIKVAFFVRVNKTKEDVMKVAQLLGCERGSDQKALVEFFDAKFSEALKTVGKQFDFVELYEERNRFKDEILQIIGTDLNGYALDDAAIDYLEQTPLDKMNPFNILDAEGIKKIERLTSAEMLLANQIKVDRERTLVKQNNEAKEAILELDKQLAEATEKQKREILEIQARENAQAAVVEQQEFLRSENQRIMTAEELAVAEENKNRQIIVAAKNKERTEAVETERVERDRLLEVTERERVVTLADIEKEKVIEVEKRNIQDVIRERVALERSVVEEEQKILDVEAFASADRTKQVSITNAEELAQSALVKRVQDAEAQRLASEKEAERKVIEADAMLKASEREAEAMKMLADAHAAESAVKGMSDVQVMEAEAEALRKHGLAEAEVMDKKYVVEAAGIEAKAEAMKKLDGVGKEHEEFKLRLNKDLQVDLQKIDVSRLIAAENAKIVGEALKSANIDIVGGESTFFEQIVNAVTAGKKVDRFVNESEVLTDVREALLGGDMGTQLKGLVKQFGVSSEDVKNLSVSALIGRLLVDAKGDDKNLLNQMLEAASKFGVAEQPASKLLGK